MPSSHLQYSSDPMRPGDIATILGFCVLRNIFIFRFKNINASAGFGAGGPKVPYTREHVLYAPKKPPKNPKNKFFEPGKLFLGGSDPPLGG